MRILGLEEARATILRRPPAGEIPIPPAMQRRLEEAFGERLTPEQAVDRILADVRARGDEALFHYARRLDGVELSSLETSPQEMEQALEAVDREALAALRLAGDRVREFHRATLERWKGGLEVGGLGQIVRPLERVGLYVPGGTASYPSTVLMSAIPARVAGVEQVVMATPARAGGTLPPATLAAARLAGVDKVYKIGGAQAIAALAYGTQTIPRVDKVCGPGNLFVMLAKRKVYGEVDIDGVYGPTEALIIADDSARPALCAADLLAQAEHDPLASAILITPSPGLARAVVREVARQLEGLERADIAREALGARGGIVVVESLEQAIDAANDYAPEHLALMVRDARAWLPRIRHAGGIFLGEACPEVLGDYVAGPSHVLPTGGSARFSSPLGVGHFLKVSTLVALDKDLALGLARAAATLARAEGLTAHARAAEMRLELEEGR